MIKPTKRFLDRAKTNIRRYQKILESARSRDVNESDTVVVVTDFLSDVLGYDKYEDVTTEFAVRSTFCDLAVKRSGKLQFLIEVKSIGTTLRDNHLKQAVDYAANQGAEWVVLTNGAEWQAHRVRFEQPIANDLVFTINLLDAEAKPAATLERLFLLSKEAGGATEIESFYQHKEATNRYLIARLVLDEPVLTVIRRQLRTLYPGLRVDDAQIGDLLRTEVIKRDVLEGDRAAAADKLVRRSSRKRTRSPARPRPGEISTAADVSLPVPAE